MKTSTTGVTRTLRDAGLPVGGNLKVKRGRDDSHVRVIVNGYSLAKRAELNMLKRAALALKLKGYSIEDGIADFYLNVTKGT